MSIQYIHTYCICPFSTYVCPYITYYMYITCTYIGPYSTYYVYTVLDTVCMYTQYIHTAHTVYTVYQSIGQYTYILLYRTYMFIHITRTVYICSYVVHTGCSDVYVQLVQHPLPTYVQSRRECEYVHQDTPVGNQELYPLNLSYYPLTRAISVIWFSFFVFHPMSDTLPS